MRWLIVVGVFAGCSPSGPPPAEVEACKDAPSCLGADACDRACAAFTSCCDCLAQVKCLGNNLTEDLCVKNLEGGGLISVSSGCATDPARCGVSCTNVIGPPKGWACDPTLFGDGACDCGCGVTDSDCAAKTEAACDTSRWHCPTAEHPIDGDNAHCSN